mmetsp:Transcript_3166/g.9127  ORF Transcript_3166/g.9127 Transcript_3166/m.9127 type:complete len:188 (+) Transcript_3166:244-807(+)
MATEVGAHGEDPSGDAAVAAEQTWGVAGEKLRSVNASEKAIEQKQRELQSCIAQNYARIQGVERELAGLQLQLKLTSGPRASALEMMRRKIEQQAEKVISARAEHATALKAADVTAAKLAAEEAAKDKLCQELNLLVQQSAHAQLNALDALTRRVQALTASGSAPGEGTNGGTAAAPAAVIVSPSST